MTPAIETAARAAYEHWREQRVAAGRHEPENCPCRDGHNSPDLCEILCSRCGGSGGSHPKHDRRGCSQCSRELRGWDGLTEARREHFCGQVAPVVAALHEHANQELLAVRAALRNFELNGSDAVKQIAGIYSDLEGATADEQIRDKHRILGEYQTAVEALKIERDAAREALRQARPFVAIATSHTSGREFRENVERVLGRIDAALAGSK